jgi:squalene-hopene/tetraprenyl-beta-curcumene cyclase
VSAEFRAGVVARARAALARGIEYLLARQHADGYWKGALDSNVSMDAEDLLLREFLGIRREDETRLAAAWIRSQQRADGSFANYPGGPAELSTTLEAYVALRLAGDAAQAPHLARAAACIRELGGVERTRVFTRIWLALFGLWPWQELPALPPEAILLPPSFPLNVYDFGCWARQTIVPLLVVAAHRPVRPLPFGIDELRTGAPPRPRPPLSSWGGRLVLLDRVLHRYERRPWRRLRRHALALCEQWIVRRQEADGGWGGIQPPWVYSLLALHLQGYGFDHPVMQRGIAGLEGFLLVEGGKRRLEACQSPVWDSALAMLALSDAGLPRHHPALVRAADWILAREVRVPGDWAVRRPVLEPGGFSFEFANVNYPDIDDTAEVVLALRRVEHPEPARLEAAIERGVAWVLGMQCRDGGFAAFDVDNTRALCRELPFCDFGEVIDPPTADVTAHVIEMLAGEGLADSTAMARARAWLLRAQEGDGSWFGRWGVNHVYGTGAAVPALVAAGEKPASEALRRAVAWLGSVQNADGGFGEDLRSYRDPAWRGVGDSTPSQTAWALLALLAAGAHGPALERGIDWLARSQREDGGWDEPQYTGTGFPGDFYLSYEIYRFVFPLMALGRFAALARERE